MKSRSDNCGTNSDRLRFARVWVPALALIVLIQGREAEAKLLAPYEPDADTLHLWHLNEPCVPLADAVKNGADLLALENGATLGNESYVGLKSFGTALGTYVGNPALPPGCAAQSAGLFAYSSETRGNDDPSMRYAGNANAFTYEAIVRVDFNPTVNYGSEGWGRGQTPYMQIISGEAAEDRDRVFQFRLSPVGTVNGNEQPLLEFINLNKGGDTQTLSAAIPTRGPDAIGEGYWYHLAVTYDGQPDRAENFRFYWTLLDPERTAANQIGSGRLDRSLPTGCHPDFAIGQTRRSGQATPSSGGNFVGLIDEVRISSVARSPGEMLFGPANSAELVAGESGRLSPPQGALVEPETSTGAGAQSVGMDSVMVMNGAIARGPTNLPRLALMFSCREADASAYATVEALKVHQARASFFVTKDFLLPPANRLLVQSMLVQGHYVGLQSDSWGKLTADNSLSVPSGAGVMPEEVAAHLKQLAAFGLGAKDVRFFLPNSEQLNPVAAERTRTWGLHMVAGTPGTLSYATATVEGAQDFVSSQAILDSILKQEAQDGGLNGYLLLFPLDSGARSTDKFYARLGELIATLRNRGYELVRLDQLLECPDSRRATQPSLVHLNPP